MLLTKHENTTFTNQTVYISGQAFIRCGFVACTLVLRGEGETTLRCLYARPWDKDPAEVRTYVVRVELG